MIMIISFASKLIVELLESVNLDINKLSSYGPTEYFKTKIYASLVLSLIFSSPLWLLSVYNFAKPGLTELEKKNLKLAFSLGLAFFLIGCTIGLYLVAPQFLNFILSDNEVVTENLSIYETIKIIISTTLFTGLLISTPILTLLVNRLVEDHKEIRKYIYTLILFIAIIATPNPSMILNLIFLTTLLIVAEMTIFVTRRIHGN